VSDPQKPVTWPGTVLCLGFLYWFLFIIWTIRGVLPWQ